MKFLVASVLFVALGLPSHADPVPIIPPEWHGAVQPQVAFAPGGRVHIVFGKERAVYYCASQDGRSFTAPIKIAELEKLALGMHRGPRIAAASDAQVVITAISHDDGNLHSWLSSDAGQTWQPGATLNAVARSAREGLQDLAADSHGRVGAVWLDDRQGGKELRARLSRDGGRTWGDDLSIYRSPDGHICECCAPHTALGGEGQWIAMWRNSIAGTRDLYLAASDDGQTFSSAQKLGLGAWKFNACPMDGGSLAISSEGSWLAVWRKDRSVYATTPDRPEELLANGAANPVAAFAGKTPVILWESDGNLVLRRGRQDPVRFATKAAAAAMASAPAAAAVVWESGAGENKTVLFDRIAGE